MKHTVIYHSADFDGIFCREIARKFLGDSANYIGWNHGDPKLTYPEEGNVYVLDLSPECFEKLPVVVEHLKGLVWIDHHKTSIDQFSPAIAGYRIDGVAACRLAWQWFFNVGGPCSPTNQPHDYHLPHKEDFVDRKVDEPFAVRLAGEYDIWDKRDPDAELFQHGLRSRELTENIWDFLLQLPTPPQDGKEGIAEIMVGALLDAGRALQYARTQENASIIKDYGFTVVWEGLTILCCNHARFNSLLFTAGLRPEHDALMGFNYDGAKANWRVSLYHAPGHESHDLSAIAKRYGGGGHRGACGFRLNQLPNSWLKLEDSHC